MHWLRSQRTPTTHGRGSAITRQCLCLDLRQYRTQRIVHVLALALKLRQWFPIRRNSLARRTYIFMITWRSVILSRHVRKNTFQHRPRAEAIYSFTAHQIPSWIDWKFVEESAVKDEVGWFADVCTATEKYWILVFEYCALDCNYLLNRRSTK